ncbi:MAG: redoxin [Haloquadratum walsbyi J07HQW1]|uniref:Redoxin n=1 Tax=Haloquadratum walsbyi J07HQW1 TaxID=1238424 RepID=U1PIQ9_9EURY|nr:MAG: redoxin [Haloquadratum walsbyi J07HQW1]
MRRRGILKAAGGVVLTGGSVIVLQRGVPTLSSTETQSDTSGGSSGTINSKTTLPIQLSTLRNGESTEGTIQIPTAGMPTIIDLFATWCTPCQTQMDALSTVYNKYNDQVRFVSVTNERIGGTLTRADIRSWWDEHDGKWSVGLDPQSRLMSVLGAQGLPYIALTDPTGDIQWEDVGVTSVSTLQNKLDAILTESE